MFVLGIDPGLSRCGYGVVRQKGSTTEFITAGVISTPPSDPTPRRLLTLREDIRELIAEFSPDAVAVERVLFQANVSTAMGVGQASGVALTEAEDYGCEIAEYSPNQIKLAVAGYGGADKGEIARMIKLLLGLGELPKPADAADALATALCHLAFATSRTAGGRTAAGRPTASSKV